MSDIAALSLNYLPPHYIVNADREQNDELGSPWVMIESAVSEAIRRVAGSPNHKDAVSLSKKNPAAAENLAS